MNQYQLFSEWRAVTLYGESLSDALTRAGKLRRPDRYEDGTLVERGEVLKVKRIVQAVDTYSSERGGKPYAAVLAELESGEIVRVDARELPVTPPA